MTRLRINDRTKAALQRLADERGEPWGRVVPGVMVAIEERLRLLLGLA